MDCTYTSIDASIPRTPSDVSYPSSEEQVVEWTERDGLLDTRIPKTEPYWTERDRQSDRQTILPVIREKERECGRKREKERERGRKREKERAREKRRNKIICRIGVYLFKCHVRCCREGRWVS